MIINGHTLWPLDQNQNGVPGENHLITPSDWQLSRMSLNSVIIIHGIFPCNYENYETQLIEQNPLWKTVRSSSYYSYYFPWKKAWNKLEFHFKCQQLHLMLLVKPNCQKTQFRISFFVTFSAIFVFKSREMRIRVVCTISLRNLEFRFFHHFFAKL